MQFSAPEYVRGFQDGYAAMGLEMAAHAAKLSAAATVLEWVDGCNTSATRHGLLSYRVEFSGSDWACYWSNGYTLKCCGHRPSRETAKGLVALRLARG
jgi:hypothetical protein